MKFSNIWSSLWNPIFRNINCIFWFNLFRFYPFILNCVSFRLNYLMLVIMSSFTNIILMISLIYRIFTSFILFIYLINLNNRVFLVNIVRSEWDHFWFVFTFFKRIIFIFFNWNILSRLSSTFIDLFYIISINLLRWFIISFCSKNLLRVFILDPFKLL